MAVHIYPINDWIEHDTSSEASDCQCLCDPEIIWIDEETQEFLASPIVIHNAIDQRE